jgi:hypothetical protein
MMAPPGRLEFNPQGKWLSLIGLADFTSADISRRIAQPDIAIYLSLELSARMVETMISASTFEKGMAAKCKTSLRVRRQRRICKRLLQR